MNQQNDNQLQRNLSSRHIQFMAISGAIGTGLFIGSGKTISLAGPSVIFVYMIIGFFLFFVMRAMGEILLSNLNYKSFSDFASDILGAWAGFFTGWTYWFCWVITGIADIIAIADYTAYWFPEISHLIPMFLSIIVFLFLNFLNVKLFGETEFWFSIIKIITILAVIVLGLYLVITQFHYTLPNGTENVARFSNLWDKGGMFPHGVFGFFAGFQIAVFAFVGIELVGTTAAEAHAPTQTLPRAINAVPIRVIIFYVCALIIIMTIIPWNSFSASNDNGELANSPFVQLFGLIGLPAAASIINFVVLTSAASSSNSGIYSTSRMLFGLAKEHKAPKIFAFLSKNAVPINGLIFSCICLALGGIVTYAIPDMMTAFQVVTTIAAILFMFIWTIILCSYIVYRKKHPERHIASKFKMPGGVFMCVLTLCFFVFILALLPLAEQTRIGLYTTPIWFLLLIVAYRIRLLKTK